MEGAESPAIQPAPGTVPAPGPPRAPPNKVFVGGLSWETT